MIAAILGIISTLLSFFKKKDERDVAHDAGVDQGRAEQKAADQTTAIQERDHVIDAQRSMANTPLVGDDDAVHRLRDGTA